MIKTALIMAGGKGERFWPRSRQSLPKQFLSLTDDDKTMIQLTVERISPIVDVENVYVVTNKDYKHLVKEQIPGIPMQKLKDEDLIENVSVDTFRIPKRPADEIRKRSRFSEEYITRGFDCKEKATKYRELRKGSCFICSETMDRVVRWFSDNKNYYAVFKCKKHGLISAKFKVKKSDLGYFYGVRNMSRIDESAAETIKEKRDREREKQKEYERNE